MAWKGRSSSPWKNGFNRTGPGTLEYFEDTIGRELKRVIQDENSYQFQQSTMREDREKMAAAETLMARIEKAIQDFIYKKDGNREDAYEILFSKLSERAVRKFAYQKFHLIDPLNPPTAGTDKKQSVAS